MTTHDQDSFHSLVLIFLCKILFGGKLLFIVISYSFITALVTFDFPKQH